MNKPFKFKQFTIHQDQCAMKIGTDGVLLGAWTKISSFSNSILDVGTGTGVIALMLAQRSNAHTIDAVEINPNAYEQCVENFENSSWNDRLFCYHADFKDFAEEIDDKYDLITCNPPYFEASGEKNKMSSDRKTARFKNTLSFEELIKGVSILLSEKGNFAVIIPFENQKEFIALANQYNLYCNFLTDVKGHKNAPFKRSLLQFSFEKQSLKKEELVIEIERHIYTKEYIDLTKDFYLKM